MVCRQCGTEIAAKAIICYKCGSATAVPASGRSQKAGLDVRPAKRTGVAALAYNPWFIAAVLAAAAAAWWWLR